MTSLAPVALALAAITLGGCYRSHVRADPSDAAIDARPDAARPDAFGRDAAEVDAGPRACTMLATTGSVLLDEGVTPRLVALPGGDVGVVYVRTDGDPTRVVYERLDASLTRITGAVTVTTDSFTWAEIARVGDELLIAYGLAGSRESSLVHVTFDGAPTGEREIVPLEHPSIFQTSTLASRLLWAAFEMRDGNALVLAHVQRDGALLTMPARIELGRYGSGHHALPRADGSHVLGYSREGPPGTRHGHVRAVDVDGTLGAERQLDPDDSDRSVIPVALGEELVLVRQIDDALAIERTDPSTLAQLDRVMFPETAGAPIAASLADRLVVASAASGVFQWDFFAEDLTSGDRYEIPLPLPGIGGGTSVVAQPGAVVFAIGLVDGPRAMPWLVRVACVD